MKSIIVIVAMLLSFNSFAQTEILGNINGQISRLASVDTKYDIVQTDQNGKVLTTFKPLEVSTFSYNDSMYSLCSYTNVYNGYITSNPGDYDYWLVERLEDVNVLLYPNPTAGELVVSINSLNDNLNVYVYDIQLRLMLSSSLSNYINTVNLQTLSDGTYLIDVRIPNKTFKTTKICLIKNK